MRIFADKLPEHLERQLFPIYLIIGSEPLLIHESRQAIHQKAEQAGFDEKHRFALDAQLDWNQVYDCCQALSLFSARQIIELEVPESGLPAGAAKELTQLTSALNPDILLIFIGQKITRQQESSKWFKSLSANAAIVNCLTPDINRLPQFVAQRCRSLNLVADTQATQMLAQWHEGNLLALSQSLEKLALIYPDGQLTLVRVEEALSRHNHFTPFQWVDALLAGQSKRAQRILRQLESEGVEAIIMLRTIQKELLLLLEMHSEVTHQPITRIFETRRIWQNKRPLYNAAIGRLQPTKLAQLLSLITRAEIESKTSYGSVWPLLAQLSLECCAPDALIPS